MAFNTKLILKNTFILYLRLFVVIILTFYTSRVLLQVLGVEDFGIYGVVAGIFLMFASFKGSFASATQRFYNYEIGQSNNQHKITEIFNLSLLIHIGIAFILFILLESIGIFLLNNALSIPSDRLWAANIVLQTTISSAVISTLIIPFDAMIMARERMNYYALISIIDASLKLGLVLLLNHIDGDRLVYYGYIMLLISIINLILSSVYCFKKFSECRIRLYFNKNQFKEIATFGGWNFMGNLGFSMCQEGNNFLLNIFGGVTANAARGIVTQLKGAIMSFLSNTLVALRPQATQEYAANNYEGFYQTIFHATKSVYFIALCLAIPLYFCAEQILNLWLTEVPANTVLFLRIILIQMIIRSFHEPLDIIFKAIGRLKGYQLISLFTQTLMLPITFMILHSGAPIYWVFINMCVSEMIELLLIIRLAGKYGLTIRTFINEVIKPILITSLTLILSATAINALIPEYFILKGISLVILGFMCVYFIGLNHTEKSLIKKLLSKFIPNR